MDYSLAAQIGLEDSLCTYRNTDSMAALAMSRCRRDWQLWEDMEPWQRIGPELLDAVAQQDDSYRGLFLRETVAYMRQLDWIRSKKRMKTPALVMAANDAVDRLMYRHCTDLQAASLVVGMRIDTYAELRAEAVAFLVNVFAIAARKYHHALKAES